MKSRNKKTEGVKSSLRTLALFEMFSSIQKPATVGEISQHLGIPQSSTSALVKSLLSAGYLEKSPGERTVKPTMRISLLGSWINQSHELSGTLPKMLENLRNETDETVVLAQRNGIYADYIYGFESRSTVRMHFVPGIRCPLACCAAGWAILKYDKPDDVGKIIRRTRAETDNPRWIKTLDVAEAKILETQKNGYAMTENHTSKNASALAISVPTKRRRARLSIVIGGPSERMIANKNQYWRALRDVKSQLSITATEDVLEGIR